MTRILVVDDEPHIVSMVTRALSAEGYETTACEDGAAGLERASRGDIDLVILDVGLPAWTDSRFSGACAATGSPSRSSC
jgi:DNA-binding response OmpR family regulator